MANINNKYIAYLFSLCIFILGIVLWEILIRNGIIAGFIIPAPSSIFHTLIHDFPIIAPHLWHTLFTTISGIIIAIVCAFILAILMEISPYLQNILYPFILLFQIVPIIIFAPILIIWLGYGTASQLFIIILMVLFPMLITLKNGLASTPVMQLNLMRVMGARTSHIYKWVKIPTALLQLFSGMRLSMTYGVTASVFTEWIGAIQGLGVIMLRSQKSFLITRVFAITFIILVISVCLYMLVLLLERVILPWKKFIYEV